jgi:hypothetical protein
MIVRPLYALVGCLAVNACDAVIPTLLETFEDDHFTGCTEGEPISVSGHGFVCEGEFRDERRGTIKLYYDPDSDGCFLKFGWGEIVPVRPTERSCVEWYLANASH